jgi:hypothetical protein
MPTEDTDREEAFTMIRRKKILSQFASTYELSLSSFNLILGNYVLFKRFDSIIQTPILFITLVGFTYVNVLAFVGSFFFSL